MISLVYTAYAVDPGNPRTLTTEPKPNSQFSVLWLVSKCCNIVAIVLFFDLTAVAKCQNPVFATINRGLSAFFKQAFSNLVRANIVPPVQYSQKPNTAFRVIHCGLYLWIIHTIKQGYYSVILVPAALRAGGTEGGGGCSGRRLQPALATRCRFRCGGPWLLQTSLGYWGFLACTGSPFYPEWKRRWKLSGVELAVSWTRLSLSLSLCLALLLSSARPAKHV